MISKIKNIWEKYNLGFYGYVLGSFIMGTIHLIMICMSFSWLVFNYMLFCYIMMAIRLVIWYADKKSETKKTYLIGAISLFIILIPLTVSLIKTILDREYKPFIFEWLIYAYALFAFTKLIVGIVKLVKARDTGDSIVILCWFNIVDALFTMFMLEFTMIRAFNEVGDNSLLIIEYVFQAFIIALTVFITIMFFVRHLRLINKIEKSDQKT